MRPYEPIIPREVRLANVMDTCLLQLEANPGALHWHTLFYSAADEYIQLIERKEADDILGWLVEIQDDHYTAGHPV
jgi:hypothetical protein